MSEAYLDNAATTRLDPRVASAIAQANEENHGNASSLHRKGVRASLVLEEARAALSERLGCATEEIVFTSGGTEANHLAVLGFLLANGGKKGELVISAIEHPSLLHAGNLARDLGFGLKILPVDGKGRVPLETLARTLGPDTRLVSIMHANNEIGTVQELEAISGLCRERGVAFHTDATQSFGKLPIDLSALPGVTLLTANAHKIHGPVGAGALFVRRGTLLKPLLGGGGQEGGLRAGTQNVVAIHGFGKAASLSTPADWKEASELRQRLLSGMRKLRPDCVVNGDESSTLGTIASITLPGTVAKNLLFALSKEGIYISTGSACASGKTEPSHVLTAIGLDSRQAQETIRVSLGKWTTPAEIDRFLEVMERLAGKGQACLKSS